MEPSAITAPSLIKVRLVSTSCESSDPSVDEIELQFELKHRVQFKPNPEKSSPGFALLTSTNLVGKIPEKEADEISVNITCDFAADFIIQETNLTGKDYESISEVYANQVFPTIRQHLIEVLSHMGINGMALPPSLHMEAKTG